MDAAWSSTSMFHRPPELWYPFKAAIIRRLTHCCCYDRMLWEGISVPSALGRWPSLKVTEILQILHVSEGRWTHEAGRSSWIWKSLLVGPVLTAPVYRIGFTQQIPPLWETGGMEASESAPARHTAKVLPVLMLIIDQMIKADEEILFLKVGALTCPERAAKRSILSITPRALLSVTLSKVITTES